MVQLAKHRPSGSSQTNRARRGAPAARLWLFPAPRTAFVCHHRANRLLLHISTKVAFGSIFLLHVFFEPHGDINVFENLSRRNADHSLARLHQIISLASGVLAAKAIDESEIRTELSGFHQKASAVSFPFF